MNTTLETKTCAQSKKLLVFRLYGSFAHFNQPISNRFRNTYSIIPKPQLLGILGAITGLEGYKNSDTSPRFYTLLRDIKIYIKTNNPIERKFTVKYNSMNSFLNNRVDAGSPNVMINEQVLLEPDYEIGLLLDENNELHKTLIENIQRNQGVFPIYLGKNEFFANVQYLSLEDYEINSEKQVDCSSIIAFEELEKGSSNMKLELLPIDFNGEFKYIYQLMAISIKKCSVSLKNPSNFILAQGNAYYVF